MTFLRDNQATYNSDCNIRCSEGFCCKMYMFNSNKLNDKQEKCICNHKLGIEMTERADNPIYFNQHTKNKPNYIILSPSDTNFDQRVGSVNKNTNSLMKLYLNPQDKLQNQIGCYKIKNLDTCNQDHKVSCRDLECCIHSRKSKKERCYNCDKNIKFKHYNKFTIEDIPKKYRENEFMYNFIKNYCRRKLELKRAWESPYVPSTATKKTFLEEENIAEPTTSKSIIYPQKETTYQLHSSISTTESATINNTTIPEKIDFTKTSLDKNIKEVFTKPSNLENFTTLSDVGVLENSSFPDTSILECTFPYSYEKDYVNTKKLSQSRNGSSYNFDILNCSFLLAVYLTLIINLLKKTHSYLYLFIVVLIILIVAVLLDATLII